MLYNQWIQYNVEIRQDAGIFFSKGLWVYPPLFSVSIVHRSSMDSLVSWHFIEGELVSINATQHKEIIPFSKTQNLAETCFLIIQNRDKTVWYGDDKAPENRLAAPPSPVSVNPKVLVSDALIDFLIVKCGSHSPQWEMSFLLCFGIFNNTMGEMSKLLLEKFQQN